MPARTISLLVRAASVMWALAAASAFAGSVIKLDDTMTIVSGGGLTMHHDVDRYGPRAGPAARGSTVVRVMLDTSAYVGRRVRIHQSIAPSQVPFVVSWDGGRFLRSGQSGPGQRVLVFDGQLPTARLEDEIRLSLVVNGNSLEARQQLQFSYDIEVLS